MANVVALHAAVGCTPTCPDFTNTSIDLFDRVGDVETDVADEDSEVVGRVVLQEAETSGAAGQTTWTFGFEDSPTVLVLGFPSDIPLATPPSSGCCDVRLPAAKLSVRSEVQLFADDGLWMEASTPAGNTTEGLHSSFDDEPTLECRFSGGEFTRRHPLRFSFADAPAFFGETRRGEIDGIAVVGHVLSDALFMDSGTPVAVVGRE